MSRTNFIPARDADLLSWMANYSQKISATPSAYGLQASDATALANLAADFTTRLATATHPDTRTKVATTAKNISRAALVAKCRALARIINADPDTTDTQRQELGLTVRDREPSPTPVPATKPTLAAVPLGGRQVGLTLVDELTPTSRAKPAGVKGAYLWMKLAEAGAPAPAGPSECTFAGTITRTNHVLNNPEGSASKVLWVIAQWVNDKGEAGPVSPAVSCTIAA